MAPAPIVRAAPAAIPPIPLIAEEIIPNDCICWNAVPTPTSPPSNCAIPVGAFITADKAPMKKITFASAEIGTAGVTANTKITSII